MANAKEAPAVVAEWDQEAIVVADPTGVIRLWSSGAERLFGHPASSAVGRTLDLIVPEQYRERHWAGFHAAMRAGRSRLGGAAAVIPVTHRDGGVLRCPGRFLFLTDARERVVGAIAIFAPGEGPDSAGRPLPSL